jgi:hypothetical protein
VRCLQNPEDLCHAEMLLDNMLTPKQAQRLLRMICYPENPAAASDNQEQPQVITRILEVSHQSFLFLTLFTNYFFTESRPVALEDVVARLATYVQAASA